MDRTIVFLFIVHIAACDLNAIRQRPQQQNLIFIVFVNLVGCMIYYTYKYLYYFGIQTDFHHHYHHHSVLLLNNDVPLFDVGLYNHLDDKPKFHYARYYKQFFLFPVLLLLKDNPHKVLILLTHTIYQFLLYTAWFYYIFS